MLQALRNSRLGSHRCWRTKVDASAVGLQEAKDLGLAISARQIAELLAGRTRVTGIDQTPLSWFEVGKGLNTLEGVIPARRSCCIVGLPKANKTQLIVNMIEAQER